MSSIQTFKYKRKKLTVIFWNVNVWFDLKEIAAILGYKKSLLDLFFLAEEKERFSNLSVRLISIDGLYRYTYYKVLKPKQREKAQELYNYVEKEVMPVFNEYIKSWI